MESDESALLCDARYPMICGFDFLGYQERRVVTRTEGFRVHLVSIGQARSAGCGARGVPKARRRRVRRSMRPIMRRNHDGRVGVRRSHPIPAVSCGHPTKANAAFASVPAGFMSERPISIGFGAT